MPQPSSGHLVLVVGPSGVGKDSLLSGARDFFANDPEVLFPTRTITRAAEAGGEVHTPTDVKTFKQLAASGQFAFHWGAHGLFYGIPRSIDESLSNGCAIIVNVSRTILDDARARYQNVTVLSIITQRDVLENRLKSRGRESDEEIQRRLARADQMRPQGPDVIEVDNSGSLTKSIQEFIDAILSQKREPA